MKEVSDVARVQKRTFERHDVVIPLPDAVFVAMNARHREDIRRRRQASRFRE